MRSPDSRGLELNVVADAVRGLGGGNHSVLPLTLAWVYSVPRESVQDTAAARITVARERAGADGGGELGRKSRKIPLAVDGFDLELEDVARVAGNRNLFMGAFDTVFEKFRSIGIGDRELSGVGTIF